MSAPRLPHSDPALAASPSRDLGLPAPPTGEVRSGAARARSGRPALRARLHAALRSSGLEALLRLAWWSVLTLGDAIAGAALDVLHPRASHPGRRAQRVERAARRAVQALGALKGAFAKAGQFASLRHDVLPASVRGPLSTLQDRVPALDFDEIRGVVEAELGSPIEARFASFDAAPLGAASIAQVHRAVMHDGRSVAVKVQYPWVAASLPSDLRLIRALVGLLARTRRSRGRGRIDWPRFVDEFADGVGEELDFVREGRVATAIAENLSGDPQIVVPEIVSQLTTPRMLVMQYHESVGIGDHAELDRLGVDRAQVLGILARAYAKQVFVDGLFHADPHPGNLFVLREPDADRRPRVLFVDFGLSKQLSPALRGNLRKGIYALLQRDLDGFLARMADMDMIAPGAEANVRRAVESMFERIARESESAGVLAASGSQILSLKDEAKRLLDQTPGLQLPNDLLLYAKTLSYLFALGQELAPQVDVMKVALPYLLRFLASKDEPSA